MSHIVTLGTPTEFEALYHRPFAFTGGGVSTLPAAAPESGFRAYLKNESRRNALAMSFLKKVRAPVRGRYLQTGARSAIPGKVRIVHPPGFAGLRPVKGGSAHGGYGDAKTPAGQALVHDLLLHRAANYNTNAAIPEPPAVQAPLDPTTSSVLMLYKILAALTADVNAGTFDSSTHALGTSLVAAAKAAAPTLPRAMIVAQAEAMELLRRRTAQVDLESAEGDSRVVQGARAVGAMLGRAAGYLRSALCPVRAGPGGPPAAEGNPAGPPANAGPGERRRSRSRSSSTTTASSSSSSRSSANVGPYRRPPPTTASSRSRSSANVGPYRRELPMLPRRPPYQAAPPPPQPPPAPQGPQGPQRPPWWSELVGGPFTMARLLARTAEGQDNRDHVQRDVARQLGNTGGAHRTIRWIIGQLNRQYDTDWDPMAVERGRGM